MLGEAEAAALLGSPGRWEGAATGRPLLVVDGGGGSVPSPGEAPVVVVAVADEPGAAPDGADVYLTGSSGPVPPPWVRCASVDRALTDLAARIAAHRRHGWLCPARPSTPTRRSSGDWWTR